METSWRCCLSVVSWRTQMLPAMMSHAIWFTGGAGGGGGTGNSWGRPCGSNWSRLAKCNLSIQSCASWLWSILNTMGKTNFLWAAHEYSKTGHKMIQAFTTGLVRSNNWNFDYKSGINWTWSIVLVSRILVRTSGGTIRPGFLWNLPLVPVLKGQVILIQHRNCFGIGTACCGRGKCNGIHSPLKVTGLDY